MPRPRGIHVARLADTATWGPWHWSRWAWAVSDRVLGPTAYPPFAFWACYGCGTGWVHPGRDLGTAWNNARAHVSSCPRPLPNVMVRLLLWREDGPRDFFLRVVRLDDLSRAGPHRNRNAGLVAPFARARRAAHWTADMAAAFHDHDRCRQGRPCIGLTRHTTERDVETALVHESLHCVLGRVVGLEASVKLDHFVPTLPLTRRLLRGKRVRPAPAREWWHTKVVERFDGPRGLRTFAAMHPSLAALVVRPPLAPDAPAPPRASSAPKRTHGVPPGRKGPRRRA